MGLLLFLLVLAIAFTWMVVRSIRAGYGKGIFWLGWFLFGLSLVTQVQLPAPAGVKILVQAWAYSIIGLPVWWTIQALRRANRKQG